jgi:hypothetical protein
MNNKPEGSVDNSEITSMQQPAVRFCEANLPEHHRLEDPISSLA